LESPCNSTGYEGIFFGKSLDNLPITRHNILVNERGLKMITLIKFVFGTMAAAGALIILGTAGADCDGKCMENALTIAQILEYTFYGFALIAFGAWGLIKLPE